MNVLSFKIFNLYAIFEYAAVPNFVLKLQMTLDCSTDVDAACGAAEDFKCVTHHQCIPQKWRCDGDQDCFDDSDEENCGKLHFISIYCHCRVRRVHKIASPGLETRRLHPSDSILPGSRKHSTCRAVRCHTVGNAAWQCAHCSKVF